MDSDQKSVGFTFKDFLAIYGNSPSLRINGSEKLEKYIDYKSKDLYKSIPAEDRKVFNKVSVNGYDVIMANSGGHKCITNISGINYLYSNAKFEDPEKRVRNSYIDLLKDIQNQFVQTLKEKINQQSDISENHIRLKKKLILSENTFRLKKLINEEEKKAWSKGVWDNGDGIKTPKVTVNKSDNFLSVKYEGPETGFNLESAVLNPNDTIHQLSNVFTFEVNKHLKDLFENGVFVKPNMKDIKMSKSPRYFEIKVNFENVDEKDALTRMDRRGGMGHSQSTGKAEMVAKCKKYAGCDGVHTVKSGNITEHFISYKNEPRDESEEFDPEDESSDVIKTLEKISTDEEKFQKGEKPYPKLEGVEVIQTALQFLGFSLPQWGVDGKFGPETEKAVMNFQEKISMEPNGIVDNDVIEKLLDEVKRKGFDKKDLEKIQKNKTENLDDNKEELISDNILIGDSQTPFVANASNKFKLISKKGSESSLWLGGKTLSWLLKALKDHKGSKKVKNIAICIGTNGAFSQNDDVTGLVDELKNKFPNAKLFAIQGSWNWGGLKNIEESKVRKYYQKFKNEGVTVIDPPIGPIEPHGNKPVYKLIGANLDSKV